MATAIVVLHVGKLAAPGTLELQAPLGAFVVEQAGDKLTLEELCFLCRRLAQATAVTPMVARPAPSACEQGVCSGQSVRHHSPT